MEELEPATNLPSLPTPRSECDGEVPSIPGKTNHVSSANPRPSFQGNSEWGSDHTSKRSTAQENSPVSPKLDRTNNVWQARTPRTRAELQNMLKEVEVNNTYLPEKPKPKLMDIRPSVKPSVRMQRIQKFISSFEYNHTGTNYFTIRKDRGPKRLASTAREIMRECLPIKCIEAVFLGFYLTLQMTDFVRIPVRFQSKVQNGKLKYKHIVMAVYCGGKWGALGLSRKKSLMYKDLAFPSLSSLLADFRDSYSEIDHELEHIGIGLPFGFNEHSVEPIHWRPLMIHFTKGRVWDEKVENAIDVFTSKVDTISAYVLAHETLPAWYLQQFPNVDPVSSDQDVEDDRFVDPGPGSPKRANIPTPKSSQSLKVSLQNQIKNQNEAEKEEEEESNDVESKDCEDAVDSLSTVKEADFNDIVSEKDDEHSTTSFEDIEEEEKDQDEMEWKKEEKEEFYPSRHHGASPVPGEMCYFRDSSPNLEVCYTKVLFFDGAMERRSPSQISHKFSPLNTGGLPDLSHLLFDAVEASSNDESSESTDGHPYLRIDEAVLRVNETRSPKSEPLNPGPRQHEKRPLKASPYPHETVPGMDEGSDSEDLNISSFCIPTLDKKELSVPTLSTPTKERKSSTNLSPRTKNLHTSTT